MYEDYVHVRWAIEPKGAQRVSNCLTALVNYAKTVSLCTCLYIHIKHFVYDQLHHACI